MSLVQIPCPACGGELCNLDRSNDECPWCGASLPEALQMPDQLKGEVVSQPWPMPYIEEAQKVLHSIDHDNLPPTNPSVLLAAARTIYLNQLEVPWEGGPQHAIMRLLVWTLNCMANNNSDLSHQARAAISTLEAHRPFIATGGRIE